MSDYFQKYKYYKKKCLIIIQCIRNINIKILLQITIQYNLVSSIGK